MGTAFLDYTTCKRLYNSLSYHSIGNFNESTDIGAFHVIDKTIFFSSVFHAGFMDIDHDLVQSGINFFTTP